FCARGGSDWYFDV
nr:immunoglobulin heavy chain junction region [Mus musculus]